MQWHYVNPTGGLGAVPQGSQPVSNGVFRAQAYGWDFPGFQGRDLTPGPPIEPNPTAAPCPPLTDITGPERPAAMRLFPNPAPTELHRDPAAGHLRYFVTDAVGRTLAQGIWRENTGLDVTGWPRGGVWVHIFGLQPEATISHFPVYLP